MKKVLMLVMLLGMSGCADVRDYQRVVQYSAPESLVGYWQAVDSESTLLSPDARASLTINPDGATFECREWQRAIILPGKLTQLSANKPWVNVTREKDIYSLKLANGYLEYDGMKLKRVVQGEHSCGLNLPNS